MRDQLRGEAGLELAALALELAPEVLRLHVDVQRVDVHEADAAQLAHRQRRLPTRLGRSLVPTAVLVAAPPLSACRWRVQMSNGGWILAGNKQDSNCKLSIENEMEGA